MKSRKIKQRKTRRGRTSPKQQHPRSPQATANLTIKRLNEKLRRRICALPGVREVQGAGIHEDAFFVGQTMFMHIHGHGHCDIRLPIDIQQRVLAEGKAQEHRWAPEKGYVVFVVDNIGAISAVMELIQISHKYFAHQG